MKKLIFSLIFLVGVQGFSDTCSFAPNPDIFLEKRYNLKKEQMIFFAIEIK